MSASGDFIIVVVKGMTLANNIVLRLDKKTGETTKLHIQNAHDIKWVKVKEDE